MVVWLHGKPLEVGETYLVKHTARQTKIRAIEDSASRERQYTGARSRPTQLQMNEIAAVEFEANVPLFFDPYSRNRTTGSFILIDPLSNATVGAGMIQEDVGRSQKANARTRVSARAAGPRKRSVAPRERHERHGHYPAVVCSENRPAHRREAGARAVRSTVLRYCMWTGREIAPQRLPMCFAWREPRGSS